MADSAERPGSGFVDLQAAATELDAWLWETALPLWASAGVDPANDGFEEVLTLEGQRSERPRRSRVQARQTFVFATVAARERGRRWHDTAVRGFAAFRARYRRPDGLFVNRVGTDGRVLDAAAPLYEQAFALLAMSALHRPEPAAGLLDDALELRAALDGYRARAGGFRELGVRPYQANAHMHLLEAALAWEEAGFDQTWAALADEIVDLALRRFIDPATATLQEVFDADWCAVTGEAGLVEPGHHFEWAWLLERWGRSRGDAQARSTARGLFRVGLFGVDRRRCVAIDSLMDDLSPREATARLWPQTEYLKAAMILGEDAEALVACNGLRRYLQTPKAGVWRDRMLPDGGFVEEAAPASSLYHILGSVLAVAG